MPESRDRLSRAVDIAAIFAQRRSGILGVYQDQRDLEMALFGSPLGRPAASPRTGTVGLGTIGRGRGGMGTPRRGIENTPIGSARRGNGRGRARASRSVLPSWYPRTPLRDITAVVRAIERRRERLGGSDGQEFGSPLPQDLSIPDSSDLPPVAHLEHSNAMMSPSPKLGVKKKSCPPTVGKVPKILLDITNHPSGESESSLTPQKKLLNSIDTVEKVVMEELQKLKRTPSAKKAEREKRVRTLMSMR